MAKTRRESATEHKLEEFAEDIGAMLGHAQNKAESWLSQRQAIVKHLEDVRDTATHLLSQLGREAQRVVGRPRGSKNQAGPYAPAPLSKRKRRKMSAAARAKISAAQKKRWAKQRSAQGK